MGVDKGGGVWERGEPRGRKQGLGRRERRGAVLAEGRV